MSVTEPTRLCCPEQLLARAAIQPLTGPSQSYSASHSATPPVAPL